MQIQTIPNIERLHLADVTLPQGHPSAGDSCPIYAFLVHHPEGLVLVDTGIGAGHPGVYDLYRPVHRPLTDVLAEQGVRPSDVIAVINSHLHVDHCGENSVFPGTPVYVQEAEYRAAKEPFYTVAQWVDFPGAQYSLLDGDVEILPGLSVLPTPGHTPGHQSVVVRSNTACAVIAGQAAYTAEEYARPEQPHQAGLKAAWNQEHYLESLKRIRDCKPDIVYFSHDPHEWNREERRDE